MRIPNAAGVSQHIYKSQSHNVHRAAGHVTSVLQSSQSRELLRPPKEPGSSGECCSGFLLSRADDRKIAFLLSYLGNRMPEVLSFVHLEQHSVNSVSALGISPAQCLQYISVLDQLLVDCRKYSSFCRSLACRILQVQFLFRSVTGKRS